MAKAPHLPKKTKKKKRQSGERPFLIRAFFGLFKFSLLMGVLGFILFCIFYVIRAQKFDMAEVAIMPERTVILDRNGKPLGKIHGENRDVVSIENISPNFLMSIIAREDTRFYEHPGVDFKGLARAFVRNIKDRRMTQGASTITMQLSRNTFDLSEGEEWYHELDRKFLEIFVTFRIERAYDKTEILQHYSNRIFWGHSMLGIEAASQAYLQKPAKSLTLSEGAMLAGIVRGPNAFSPFRSIERAKKERDVVLGRLRYYSYITPEQEQAALAEPLKIRPKKYRTKGQSYALDAILRELNHHLEKNNLKVGGLVVHTTIDKDLQEVAEQSVNNRLINIEKTAGYAHQTKYSYDVSNSEKAPAYIQGALVCIDNTTGEVIASVGGRDADASRFNRVYSAKRQVGSLFKPFVFQAAYDQGLRPETFIDDSPLRPGEIDHSANNWNPGNSDGRNLGLIASRTALLNSRNTSSVRVGDYATMPRVSQAAEVAGFDLYQWKNQKLGKTPKSASSYLGAWEASPYEVARAYTIFPNLGELREPYVISKIISRDKKALWQKQSGVRYADNPLAKGATYEVSKILQDININGTGASLRNTYGFTAPSGGKTGTTDDYKDAWYAGFTSRLTCAVWVGLDTPKRTINKGYGSRLALPIWADLMKAASSRPEFAPASLQYNIPSTTVTLCKRSGRLANSACQQHGEAYQDLVPNDLIRRVNLQCSIHQGTSITKIKSAPRRSEESAESVIGGLFKRIFGSKEESQPEAAPQRAIVVEQAPQRPTAPQHPPRAVIIEERARPQAPPQRAIVVESPRPIRVQPQQPVQVTPRPRAQPQPIRPARPVRPTRTAPTQAPRRAVAPRPQPQRAIIVEEPAPAPARAIVVEEPFRPQAPPQRAIIVE